jgi:hypothetical protein
MQTLPANQRAVLLLRDVLGFPATEVAAMLDTWVAAVKSRLQRARARLAEAAPALEDVVEPTSPEARRLLDAYVRAFESAEVQLLIAMLRADATLELVPDRAWYAGKEACSLVLSGAVGNPGDWRMDRTIANGQPAVAAYLQGRPFGAAVLDVRRDGIAGITVFNDPALAERFIPHPFQETIYSGGAGGIVAGGDRTCLTSPNCSPRRRNGSNPSTSPRSPSRCSPVDGEPLGAAASPGRRSSSCSGPSAGRRYSWTDRRRPPARPTA